MEKLSVEGPGEELILQFPAISHAAAIRAFKEEFPVTGNPINGTGSLYQQEEMEDWIREVEVLRDPAHCHDPFMASTQWVCVRPGAAKIVGMIQVRHKLNLFLSKYGGHIGYAVAPSERGRGIATRMLKKVLPYCKKIGFDSVLITCHVENGASRKVIQRNGGTYFETVYVPCEDASYERYRIDLPALSDEY